MKMRYLFATILFLFSYTLMSQETDTIQEDLNTAEEAISLDDTVKTKKKIFVYKIFDEIGKPTWRNTQNAMEQAKTLKADLIILHLNTYGGAVDMADSISTKILQSPIPVYVFIDNKAASAGAFISISCDSIYMRPGGSIGAATVVNQSGEVVPDKYQSFMRSRMRAVAETKGRNPLIAEAMVDPSLEVEGVIDSGKVLTFTTKEAMQHGFCEGSVESVEDLIENHLQIEAYEIVEQEFSWTDKLINFLINPAVSGILIMLILGGIYFEFQSPGIGFPLAVALLAAFLYFTPLFVEGFAENWEIIMFIIGLILVALEIFVIPGFGVAGILGVLFVFTGLTLSMLANTQFDFTYVDFNDVLASFAIVIVAFTASIFLSIWIGKRIFTRKTIFGDLALVKKLDKDDGYSSVDKSFNTLAGKTGKTLTILRPVGKVMVENEVYDATAETSYIEKGEKIEVISSDTSSLWVRKISDED